MSVGTEEQENELLNFTSYITSPRDVHDDLEFDATKADYRNFRKKIKAR